ncbi:MAG TPA: cytochrome P450 [Mycobacteriales bacterium]|nr:cytochrome P450 [Mycobacteriales bacterium]
MVDEAAVDFAAVDFFTDPSIISDPYPYYDFLRTDRGPVWYDERYNLVVVSGHPEAMAVYRDGDLYSSCNAATGPFTGVVIEAEGDDAGPAIEACRAQMPMSEFMVTMDAPMHGEYRNFLSGFFTPRRLKDNEAFMWRLADAQLDRFIDRGRCEFVSEYASPFAGLVIADLLGVPEADLPRFREGFESSTTFVVDEAPPDVPDNPLAFIEEAFRDYITDRRERPRADILTHLAQVRFSDGSEPDVEILAREASFVFAAGQETTVRLMAFAAAHLAEHPDLAERLRRDRDLIPGFVEEMLRIESPIKSHFRMARRRTTLGGVTVPAGAAVMLLIGAANRDPRRFPEPSKCDIARPNVTTQVAFARGAHSCIGQPLARSEARITLERMLDRLSGLELSADRHGPVGERDFDFLPTYIFRGLSALHLTFTAVPHG